MSVFKDLNKVDSKGLSLPPISGISIMKLSDNNKVKSNTLTNQTSKRFNSESFTTITSKKQLNKREMTAHHNLFVKIESENLNEKIINGDQNQLLSQSSPNWPNTNEIKSSLANLPQAILTSPPIINNIHRNRRSNSDFNFKKYLSNSSLFKTNYDFKTIDDKVYQSEDLSANREVNDNLLLTNRINKNSKFDPKLSFKLLKTLPTGAFGQTNLIKQINQLYSFKKITFLIQWNRKEIINNLNKASVMINNNFDATKEYLKLKLLERNRLKCLVKDFKLHTLKCSYLYYLNDMILATDLKSVYVVTDYLNNGELINLKTRLESHTAYYSKSYIPEYMIKKWFNETIEAIHYLHSNQILHANLKLTNFLLDSSESIKLCDFGYFNLFKTIMVAHVNYEMNYLKLLINDSSSSRYLPPESFQSFKYDSSSEIFSIGSIFFELLFLEKYDWMNNSNSGNNNNIYDLFDRSLNDLTFLQIILSMLKNDAELRPKSSSLKQYCEWQASVELVDLLKNGKFSLTYIAKIKPSGKTQIHKQINLNSNDNLINKDLLNNLYWHSQQNQHKNLLFIDKFIFIDFKLFTLTDYMSNGTLQHRIEHQYMVKSTKFKENLLIQWLVQISNGLSFLHDELKMVHGNLKCENILFTQQNTIKLTDFGFYHLLTDGYFNNFNESNMPPELKIKSNIETLFTTKSDIFMFGIVLFKLITLKDYDSHEFNSIKLYNNSMKINQDEKSEKSPILKIKTKLKLNDSVDFKLNLLDYNGAGDYSFKLKKCNIDMLESRPSSRPDLGELMNEWKKYDMFNYLTKLSHTEPSCQSVNGKIFNYIFRDNPLDKSFSDLMLISVIDDDYIATSSLCSSNSKKKYNNRYKTDWYFVDSTQTILDASQLVLQIPSRHACLISHNYIACCDQEKMYFLDEHLQLYKQIFLIDLFENTKNVNSVNYKPSMQIFKPGLNGNNNQNGTKSNLLVDLRLKIKSIYYDFKSKKLYILTSIQGQQCFLNLFDLEYIEKSSNKTNKLKLNIYSNKKFHILVNPRGHKTLCTNKYYILVGERFPTPGCKLFSRVNCHHLFTIDFSTNLLSALNKSNKNSALSTNENNNECRFIFNSYSFTTSSTNNDVYNNYSNAFLNENISHFRRNRRDLLKSNNLNDNDEIIQDICVDSNENIYVAYSYIIDSYNEKGEFKWRHSFRNDRNEQDDVEMKQNGAEKQLRPDCSAPTSNRHGHFKCTLDGKIIRIFINKNDEFVIMTNTRDENSYDEFRCRIYTFQNLN